MKWKFLFLTCSKFTGVSPQRDDNVIQRTTTWQKRDRTRVLRCAALLLRCGTLRYVIRPRLLKNLGELKIVLLKMPKRAIGELKVALLKWPRRAIDIIASQKSLNVSQMCFGSLGPF